MCEHSDFNTVQHGVIRPFIELRVVGREHGVGEPCEMHEEGVVVRRDLCLIALLWLEGNTEWGILAQCMEGVWLLGGICFLLFEDVVVMMVGVLY
jgi:hypothetical protein